MPQISSNSLNAINVVANVVETASSTSITITRINISLFRTVAEISTNENSIDYN